ncbi:IniB N-terminal domain-containing protein [Georgenia sp. 10Sc9-8]|uniref:IniB N-terminal domain-containing protein n=1 Tax=Georgenia halotolerans TaxID=3028317 RepID=A0ABT5U0N8_9MICO|nr:IniB N-terminal domain-containing protein [Georgenia halotolerans]
MSALALLEVIRSLLRDPAGANAFCADPEAVLRERGLGEICTDEVDAVAAVIGDHVPVRVGAPPEVVPAPDADCVPGTRPDPESSGVRQLVRVVQACTLPASGEERDVVPEPGVTRETWAQVARQNPFTVPQ